MILYLFLPALGWACKSDEEIVAKLRTNSDSNSVRDVEFQLNLDKVNRMGKEKSVFVEGYVLKTWNEPRFNFQDDDSCSETVTVPGVTHPAHLSDNVLQSDATVTRNGTVTVKEFISLKETCSTKELHFPVRSMNCALKFPLKKNDKSITWTTAPSKNLSLYTITSSTVDDAGVEVGLRYNLPFKKILVEFFLPAVIFMGVSWLSLALGPMSITRSILIIGSFLLLMRHFSHPPAEMSPTNEHDINAFAVWKTFSYLFVLVTLMELVVVTCLMSMGQGPSSCCRKNSGEYDFEPVYEELNDLRKRNSLGNTEYRMRYTEKRAGCACCRFCAMFLDLFTMVFLAVALILFIILFFNEDLNLIETINDFSIDKYIQF